MTPSDTEKQWFVLRDLKRRNALRTAFHDLADAGIEVYTPMTQVLCTDTRGKTQRRTMPVIQDLLFAHEAKTTLDSHIARIPTLQYRYLRGHSADSPMTVRDDDMLQFIRATTTRETPHYFRPDEITPDMLGREIRIVGGPVDGLRGYLLTVRGSRKRRILVRIPDIIAVALEVKPEFIQLL